MEKASGAVGAAKTKVAQSFSHQNLAEAAKGGPEGAEADKAATNGSAASETKTSQPIPEEK